MGNPGYSMSLKEIFCQDKAISILQRAYHADKSAHAYIFAGPEGVGKFKTAREWGKLLLCANPVKEKPEFADSCGSCQSCRLLEAGSHPDFSFLYKELIQFTKDGKDRLRKIPLTWVILASESSIEIMHPSNFMKNFKQV